jgi:hypothetical protein
MSIFGTFNQAQREYESQQAFNGANQRTSTTTNGLARAAFRPGFSTIDQSRVAGNSPLATAASQQRGTGGGGQAPWEGDFDNGMGGIFGEAEQEGRGLQLDALGLARGAALGQAPSVAENLGREGLDRAAREQASAAASARGPAALALAQQNAAYNTAAMQQQGSAQMAAMRADEMARARDAYMGGAGAVRGGDASRYGQELGRGTSQAGLEMEAERNRTARDTARGQIGVQIAGQGYGYAGAEQAGRAGLADRQHQDWATATGQAAAQTAADRDKVSGLARGIAGAIPGAANTAIGVATGGGGGGPSTAGAAAGGTTGQGAVNANSTNATSKEYGSQVNTSVGKTSF